MTYLLALEPLMFYPGDRMTRDEFLARWECMPQLKFAELIDGMVYMPSPVSKARGRKDLLLHAWAAFYEAESGVVEGMAYSTWFMLEDAPQPDLALRLRSEFAGQSGDEGRYASGAPEFAAEVSLSSRSYDLGDKLESYQRAGVREYLVVLLEEQRLEWRVLRDGRYESLGPAAGTYRSEVFPGLWLSEPGFWRHDLKTMMAVLEDGLRSSEFAAFKQKHLHR